MRLPFIQGILAGATLATAGTLAFGTAPAAAFVIPPDCSPTGTLAAFAASTPCTLPGGEGITLNVSNVSTGANYNILAQISIHPGNGAFGVFGNGIPAGSFDFTATAQSGFFDFADLIKDSQTTATVTTTQFTFTENLDKFNFPDSSITTISGSFSTSGAPLTSSSLLLTTTPVPGPLPVFGACAAFGFSRKLRQRTKSIS